MGENTRQPLAEFVGTFTLVFIGAGTGAVAAANGAGIVGVALAHGIALLVVVYAWGSVSGAHVNPAVTFGIALTGRITWPKALSYWGAQFLGGIVAAYLLLYLLGGESNLGTTLGTLTDGGTTPDDPLKAAVVEAVLTFFLVIAVFASGIGGRNGNAAGVAIGLVLAMDILMGGGLTGGSMNPARSLGPALATGNYSNLWVYFVGPLAGGAAGALLYQQFLPTQEKQPVRAAEGKSKR